MHILSVIVLIASFVAFTFAAYPVVVQNGNNYYIGGKQNSVRILIHSAV